MMKEIYRIDINKDVFTIEDAKAAAKAIFDVQQKDYESITHEKWYQKFLGALTFHSGDKKKTVKSISSLGKLQTLFMRVYYEQYRELDQALNEIIDDLRKVNQTVRRLYQTCVVQIRPQEELSNLEHNDKQILLLLLAGYQSLSGSNDILRKYRVGIATAVSKQLPEGVFKNKHLATVSSPKVFYRCLLEMCALDDCFATLTMPENIYDAINYLNISPFEKNNVETTLRSELESFGVEYLIDKYRTTFDSVTSIFTDSDGIDFVDENSAEVEENIPFEDPVDFSAFEEITISKIVHIPPEKTQQYRNKILHIHSFINCEGTLEFDTCVIHYGEEGHAGVIELGKNAVISMKQCTIENHSYGKQYLIEATNQNKALFSNCEFLNCCYFISTNGLLTLDGCQVISPGEKFISAYLADSTNITSCKFKLQDKPTFFPEKVQGDIISSDKISLSESEIKGAFSPPSLENAKDIDLVEQYDFLRMSSGTIKNSSFSNFSSRLRVSYCGKIDISLCTFDSCYSCIEGLVKIEDCVFNKCSKIVTAAEKGSQIKNCQFNECFCQLIATGYDGGIALEFCEFYNWHSSKPSNDTLLYSVAECSDPAMLLFNRAKKDGRCSVVQRCIFNGATAHQSFLIEGDIIEKVKGMAVSVENCFFANCTTERQSGKIIKEYAHYYGRFNAKKQLKVVSISNCHGLDRVNKESGENTEVVIKTKNSVGATIGIGAAFAVAGVPGYVVASLIKKAASDDDIHVE